MANKTISLSNPDQIEELIIEPHTILDDDGNQLVAKPLGGTLNLSIFKNATTIDCSNNAISDVGLLPESIEFFDCENNNVSGLNQSFDVPETIKELNFKNNDLGSIDIDKILQRTFENNINGIIGDGNYRKLDLEGNNPPSLIGVAYKENLELLNWEINTEPFVGDRTFSLSNVPTPPLVAYSLRNLFDPSANVVRVRRSYDSNESDFTGSDIESGVMTEWVRYADLPLDIQTVDDSISPPTRTGDAIQPRVAYGLRNLGTGANQWEYAGDTLEYASDFSAGTDNWGRTNGTVAGNVDGIGGQNDCLRFTVDGTNSTHQIYRNVFTIGATYSLSFDVYIPSTNSHLYNIVTSSSGRFATSTSQKDQWVTLQVTDTAVTNNLFIITQDGASGTYQDPAGDDVFYIRNIKVYETLGDTELLPSGKYIAQVRRNLDNTIKSFTADEITDGTLETFVKAENLVYESDFSANTNGWNGNYWGVITTANQDNILDRDDCLKCKLSNFNSHDHVVVRGVGDLPQAKVRYQVDVYVPSGNAIVDGIRLQSNGGSGGENFKNLKANAWHTLSTNLNLRGANQIRVIALSGDKTVYPGNDTDLFYIRNVKVFSFAENTLPLDETASAAYSIDNYEESGTDVTTSGDTGGDNTGKYVIQVQRSFDNEIRSFTANEVDDGTMENWVKVTYDASLSPLDQATGASAAYSLRNLRSLYTGNVVEVRRNIDAEEENFTADEVTDGTLENWVKGWENYSLSTAKNYTTQPFEEFSSPSSTGFTALNSSAEAFAGWDIPSGSTGDIIEISFDINITSGTPRAQLRPAYDDRKIRSNKFEIGTSGSYTATLKATGDYSFISFSDGDVPSDFTVSNFKVYNNSTVNELPLDQATGAAAAYSLRNLSSSYTGDVVQVRRSSDSAVKSFTAAEVADGTLEDWVGGQNLLKSSQEFNSGWSAYKIDTSNWNDVAVAPDGTTTAYEIKDDSSFGRHRISQYNIPLTVGKTYTISGYIKKNSDNRYFFLNGGHTFGVNGSVNLDTMEYKASTGANPKLTNAGNGWYRFSMTGIAQKDAGYIFYQLQDTYFSDSEYQGDGSSFYLWGTQIEEGSTVGAYSPTLPPAITIVDYEPDFTASTGGMTGLWNTLSYNETIGTDSGNLKITCRQAPWITLHQFKAPTNVFSAISGEEYTVEFEYYIPSSNTIVDGFRLSARGWTYHEESPPTDQWVSVSNTYTTTANGEFHFYTLSNGSYNFVGNNTDVVYFRNHKISRTMSTEASIAGDGFVKTWYDQSGNDYDAREPLPQYQPLIVENGSIVTDTDGKVAIKGTGARLSLGHFPWEGESPREMLSADGTHSLFIVCDLPDQTTGNADYNYISRFHSTSIPTANKRPRVFLNRTTGELSLAVEADESKVKVNSSDNQSAQLVTDIVNPSGTTSAEKHSVYIDGAFNAEQPYGNTWIPDGNTSLGEDSKLFSIEETTVDTYISELIYYPSDQSGKRRAIEENIANHYDVDLAAFSRDGTVSTWYDQSGNTNHATQTDPTKQPKIIQNGEYLGELHFDGSNDYLSNSDIGAYQSSDGVGFFCAYSKDAAQRIDPFGPTNPQYLLQLRDTALINTTFAARVRGGKLNVIRANEAASSFLATTSDAHTIGTDLVLSSVTGTQAIDLFEDGSELSLQTDESGLSYDSATTTLIIGSQDTSTRFLDGGIKEMIIYKTDQTNKRKLIEKNILNYYKIPHTSFWDGTIRTWYDQTGKENHNIETDIEKQLKIVDDGIINQSITTTAGNTASAAYSLRSLGTNQWTSKKETIVYQSDFAVQDGWSWNIGGVATPTNDTIAGYNDWLKFTSDSSSGEHLLANHLMTIGEKYRLTFEFFIPASNQKINGIQFSDNHYIYGTFNNLEKGKLHKISVPMKHGCYSTAVKLRGMYNSAAVFIGAEGDTMYIRNVELRKFNGETEELNPDKYVVQIRRESDGMVKSFTADNLKENIEAFCGEVDIDDTRPAIPVNRYTNSSDVTTEIIDPRSSVKFTLNGTTNSRYLYLTTLGIGKYKFTGSIHIKADSRNASNPLTLYHAYGLYMPLEDTSHGTTGTTFTWTEDNPLIFETTRYASWDDAQDGSWFGVYTHGTSNNSVAVSDAEITVTNFVIQQIHTDARVVTWYDQSGNTNHATQTDTAKQPKIVKGGTLLTDGVTFDATNETELSVTGNPVITASSSGTYSAFSVQNVSTGENGYLYGNASVNNGTSLYAATVSGNSTVPAYNLSDRSNANNFHDRIERSSGENLLSAVYDNQDAGLLVNGGGIMVDENVYDFSSGTQNFVIGNRNGGSISEQYLTGSIKEIIIYNSDQSDKRRIIEENIANYYDITLQALSRNGTVSTWYDQSGNNIHLTPAQPEHEPKIVSDGVIVRDRNGKIALNGNKARLNFPATTDFFSSDGSQSLFMVYDFADQKDADTGNGSNNDIINLRADTEVQKLKVRVAKPSGEIEVITNNDLSNTYNNSDTITSQQITYTFDGSTSRAALDKYNLVSIDGIAQNTDRDIGSQTSWIFDIAETVDTYISEFIYYDFDTLDYDDYEFIRDTVKPSSTGYVSKWYDQSGNNHDVSQSFADLQPWIVKDGEYIGHIQFDSNQLTGLTNSDIGSFQISSGIGVFCNYIANSTTSGGSPSYGGTLVQIYDNIDIFNAHLYIEDLEGQRNVKPQIFCRNLNDTKTLVTRSKDIIVEDKYNLFSAVNESELTQLTLFNNTAKLDLERQDISTGATTTAGELNIGFKTDGTVSDGHIDAGINEIILYQENINPTLQRLIGNDIILHHNI
jgi:hypothetical protein